MIFAYLYANTQTNLLTSVLLAAIVTCMHVQNNTKTNPPVSLTLMFKYCAIGSDGQLTEIF